MRRILLATMLAACAEPEPLVVQVWNPALGCFSLDTAPLDPQDLPADDCLPGLTPAVSGDGTCVLLPVACVPRGYGPAAASEDCRPAVAAYQTGDWMCPDAS